MEERETRECTHVERSVEDDKLGAGGHHIVARVQLEEAQVHQTVMIICITATRST